MKGLGGQGTGQPVTSPVCRLGVARLMATARPPQGAVLVDVQVHRHPVCPHAARASPGYLCMAWQSLRGKPIAPHPMAALPLPTCLFKHTWGRPPPRHTGRVLSISRCKAPPIQGVTNNPQLVSPPHSAPTNVPPGLKPVFPNKAGDVPGLCYQEPPGANMLMLCLVTH